MAQNNNDTKIPHWIVPVKKSDYELQRLTRERIKKERTERAKMVSCVLSFDQGDTVL